MPYTERIKEAKNKYVSHCMAPSTLRYVRQNPSKHQQTQQEYVYEKCH